MISDDAVTDRTETMRLDDIVPYWRNPRVVTEEAIGAVAESIRRYGYNQPIVVDSRNVIIMGHTRYAALRRIGVTEIEVRVAASLSPSKVKQLRVLDNRLHEYTLWDFDSLVSELDELDDGLMRAYFPEIVAPEDPGINDEGLAAGVGPSGPQQDSVVAFTCPSCFHEFETEVTREQLLSGRIEVARDDA